MKESDYMNNKSSSFKLRKFLSDAVRNDGIGIVKHPSGETVAYEVRYICEFPAIGKVVKKERNLLHEVIKQQAEELISKRR